MNPIAYTKDGRPIIGPQKGPQEQALMSSADIVFMGGPGGGGKSVASILAAARGICRKDFTAVIFRRQYKDLIGGGGLWEISNDIYPALGGYGVRGKTEWRFPSGAYIKLDHLNTESDKFSHQGLAWACIVFDEAPQFTAGQFFYLFTRNRNYGECRIMPYMFLTGNADAGSWCADFFKWWWNPETGYAIPERSGIIRHMYRDPDSDEILWVSPDFKDKKGRSPRSVAYVDAPLEKNELMPHRDEYQASIDSSDRVTRERIGKGNWLITEAGGLFNSEWIEIIDKAPEGLKESRYYDLAETEKDESKKDSNPCETAGARGGILDGIFYVTDVKSFAKTPGQAEAILKQTAALDGRDVDVWWEEVKANGKWVSEYLLQVFKGYNAKGDPLEADKIERFKPWAAWAEFGRVKFVRGEWNKKALQQCSKFPYGMKDVADSISGLFKVLTGPQRVFEYYNSEIHMSDFDKSRTEFDKIQPQNVVVYVAIYATSDGGIYGGCYLWSLIKNKLKIYNEIFIPQPITHEVARQIIDKVIVDLEPHENFVVVRKVLCNDDAAKPGKSNLKRELLNSGIRLTTAMQVDEISSVHRINRLFAGGAIILHAHCVETDVQLRSMVYKNKKIPEGYPLVRCLMMVESVIKEETMKISIADAKPYSDEKEYIREKIKNRGEIKTTPNLYSY